MQVVQEPLLTRFGPAMSAMEVVRNADLTGRVAVVTGGSSGLGLETVRALASSGARVHVPALDPVAARAALSGIGRVDVWPLDLADEASVKAFADAFLERQGRLDILVLNAGIMAQPLFRDPRGREAHFSTNFLGHYQLTALLWPALVAARTSRVVVMSSRGHQISDVDFEDINFVRRPYDKWMAYGQSKTANALFAVALDRRGRGHGVRAFSVHPGMIVTPGIRHLSRSEFDDFGALEADGTPVIDPTMDKKNPEQGAATSVWCATSPALSSSGGVYCENCDIASVQIDSPFGVRPYAIDPERAEILWQMSAMLTGLDIVIT
ncbi:SDR family NAD(P)-dependent oxidoreductase [Rhizobium ruizarguesonis]|uniref:SDR family NAD(P)-dependent oxidoreductase n=2 Tax=Rhizobium/Agrobacterium group TaxID=227290 RepID=A0A7M3DWC4_RHILE|nr:MULTISPECIES: SDR family NAD(P)-dependent oxidoreductase [Rhizobium]TAY52985.1 SDR family NAD(P)-dependent oxidoreductase [Rhizobium leguminosarum]TBE06154.1 SDR family NAD(P)-dependent oxidoreductase [Rhizobium ruizarguesonis]TBE86992.1 SDR family NAD(P)-dependent oxidoreductase [Rhizobium ruizarguesonis]